MTASGFDYASIETLQRDLSKRQSSISIVIVVFYSISVRADSILTLPIA